MTFVFPLLLGGLLLAGLPVLLHFLVRQKPKTLLFPAFRFLMQKRRSNTRNLRLKHLLLLLLRVALLVLLCLALARPRLFHEQLGLSREKPVAVVLVFDTSPSMEYKSGDMTRLDLAKKRSLELLDQLPEDCRVLILDASDPTRFAREDWLKSLAKARQRVNSLTIRPESTPVTTAMIEALRRFDEWDRTGDDPTGRDLPRLVCVFTDRTRASWNPQRGGEPDTAKVKTLLFDVGIDDPVDLAITQLELPAHYLGGMQQSFAAGDKITLRAVVKATGKNISTGYTMICQFGKLERKAFNVPPPGEQQTETFEIDTAGWQPGLYQAEVTFEFTTDALAFNNQRYVTFEIRTMPKVLVWADDVKKADTFVRALRALLYTVDVRSVHDKMPGLNNYAAVFLDAVAEPTEDLWRSLADYVKQGHGVAIVPGGDEMKLNAYGSDVAKQVMPAQILRKTSMAAGHEAQWNVTPIEWDRPFFRRYQSWFMGDFDITKNPRSASQYWQVKPWGSKDISVVVAYENLQPAIVERHWPGGGKVILLTTPMDEQTPAWNNYYSKLHSFYPALTMLCARYLCPEADNPTLNHVFGKEPPQVKQKQKFANYRLTGPDVSEEIRLDDRGLWIGDHLPRPGNYVVEGVNDEEQIPLAKFSINVPGEESDLSRVSIGDIEAVCGQDAVVPLDRKTSLPATLNWDEPIELFPWLMLLLLFFLAIENLLANRFYRQEPAV